ncbi:hypothetical protein TcG_13117 [Trypanosoma cruzi]|nr:hypothetical protein TcG_13117 [Trypanosoma cruzi]
MHIPRERSVVSAPLTEDTHTQEEVQRTQQHKSIATIKKEIPAYHVDCWSTGSAANIHHKQCICSRPSSTFIALNFMQAGHHRSSRMRKNKRKGWNNASNHLFVFLFGCWQIFAHVFLFCFFREQTFISGSCVGDFRRAHNLFSLVNVSCAGAANNSVCDVPAFRW